VRTTPIRSSNWLVQSSRPPFFLPLSRITQPTRTVFGTPPFRWTASTPVRTKTLLVDRISEGYAQRVEQSSRWRGAVRQTLLKGMVALHRRLLRQWVVPLHDQIGRNRGDRIHPVFFATMENRTPEIQRPSSGRLTCRHPAYASATV